MDFTPMMEDQSSLNEQYLELTNKQPIDCLNRKSANEKKLNL